MQSETAATTATAVGREQCGTRFFIPNAGFLALIAKYRAKNFKDQIALELTETNWFSARMAPSSRRVFLSSLCAIVLASGAGAADYFPSPDSEGGWRTLTRAS